ncbi:MAG: 3-phosphoshikimate 1-carboxyvinyltransferase [Bacteroidia bacterium]
MNSVVVSHPTKVVEGVVSLPASKSISNRLLILKTVAGFKDIEIHNLSNARDTQILQSILTSPLSFGEGLGVRSLDVQDAGTAMRFLTAYLSCIDGEWIITGSERMQQRPIGALVQVLRSMGADIEYLKNQGYPPLKIRGKKLKGGKVSVDASVSSQFISALLLVSPMFSEPLELHLENDMVSTSYINMTLQLMRQWGANFIWNNHIITVENKTYHKPASTLFVESDWSAASYFYSIIALAKDGEIMLPNLARNSLQGDSVCPELFEQLGVSTQFTNGGILLKKTKSKLKKTNKQVEKFAYNFINCPDIAQTLAVCCAAKNILTNLRGLQTLTLKETNRIDAIKTELGKFNHLQAKEISSPKNAIHIHPKLKIKDVTIATYNDHRMAMSFAPLALRCNQITIENPSVVDKSFPHYWNELQKLGFLIAS